MKCSQCEGYSLEPLELEPSLIAAGCEKCGGVLLPLLNYQYWLTTLEGSVDSHLDIDHLQDNKQAMICPKCARFMIKYRIDIDQSNKLDVCANCSEVWLDKGEWELLKALDVHEKLPLITTNRWQQDLNQQFLKDLQEKRYRDTLGDTAYYKSADFKMWLDQQKKKKILLNTYNIHVNKNWR